MVAGLRKSGPELERNQSMGMPILTGTSAGMYCVQATIAVQPAAQPMMVSSPTVLQDGKAIQCHVDLLHCVALPLGAWKTAVP